MEIKVDRTNWVQAKARLEYEILKEKLSIIKEIRDIKGLKDREKLELLKAI